MAVVEQVRKILHQIKITIRGPRPPLDVRIDPIHAIGYVRVRRGEVARTIEHSPGVLLDVDAGGRLLGIELVNLKRRVVARIKDVGDRYLDRSDEEEGALAEGLRAARAEIRRILVA